MAELLLGVNIDHIATLRNARGTDYPDPVQAALLLNRQARTAYRTPARRSSPHYRSRCAHSASDAAYAYESGDGGDRRDAGDRRRNQAAFCCLVPEKRQEVTTEGGLDVAGQRDKMRDACARLAAAGIQVSLFIDADEAQINAAAEVGAPFIEIHTGCYANAETDAEQAKELARIASAATLAARLGLK